MKVSHSASLLAGSMVAVALFRLLLRQRQQVVTAAMTRHGFHDAAEHSASNYANSRFICD